MYFSSVLPKAVLERVFLTYITLNNLEILVNRTSLSIRRSFVSFTIRRDFTMPEDVAVKVMSYGNVEKKSSVNQVVN